jgi:two-component system, NarL family, response regulator DegU
MDTFFNNFSHQKTTVTILSTYNLVNDCLQVLLESDRDLKVLDIVGKRTELLKKVSQNAPDVVLICLTDDDDKDIDVITDLFKVAPKTKVVILSTPNNQLNQPEALKLGVTGIVGTNQNFRTLIRAIRQVSEGEVWLNQKLIAQLIGGNLNGENGKPKTSKGLYKTDDLTNRECEVVKMVGLGMNNRDISKQLFISEATVRHHLSSIYSKLYIEDRLNLAIFAYQQGIVRPPVKAM